MKPRPRTDLTGRRFGKLLVTGEAARMPAGQCGRWVCRCDCGTVKEVSYKGLVHSKTTSCGCMAGERARSMGMANLRHGMCSTPTYNAWHSMILRCTNPNHESYADYGGRGITICERWRHSFQAFLADMGEKPDRESQIDRIDNAGDYEPGNRRWASPKEQSNNRRSNVLIELHGQTRTLAQWAEATRIGANSIARRLRSGWPVELALSRQPQRNQYSRHRQTEEATAGS